MYDHTRFKKPNRANPDSITCVCPGDRYFLVGRNSGSIHKYTIPHVALETRYSLQSRPQQIQVNCDGSKISTIDINGVLTFFDTTAQSRGLTGGSGAMMEIDRKDVWDMKWSTDHPDLIAIMEKTRMYVIMGEEVEEPIISSGYLCDFRDLEIKSVLLDEIMKSPEDPGKTD